MTRLLIVVLVGVALLGCGAPHVQIQRAEFAIMYSDIKAQVAVWLTRIEQGCKDKKLSAEVCAEIPQIKIGLVLLDEQAKDMLRQADKEPDWAKITKYAELAIGLAMKTAL